MVQMPPRPSQAGQWVRVIRFQKMLVCFWFGSARFASILQVRRSLVPILVAQDDQILVVLEDEIWAIHLRRTSA